jgi:hypothetical protein
LDQVLKSLIVGLDLVVETLIEAAHGAARMQMQREQLSELALDVLAVQQRVLRWSWNEVVLADEEGEELCQRETESIEQEKIKFLEEEMTPQTFGAQTCTNAYITNNNNKCQQKK